MKVVIFHDRKHAGSESTVVPYLHVSVFGCVQNPQGLLQLIFAQVLAQGGAAERETQGRKAEAAASGGRLDCMWGRERQGRKQVHLQEGEGVTIDDEGRGKPSLQLPYNTHG